MDASRLHALARKYRTLGAVRRDKLRTGEHTPRESMRALAREFPGSLRELDVLPLAELDSRATRLEAAARSGAAEPWMLWMADFHALLRAALLIKARLHGARTVDATRALELARAAGVDAAFAAACAAPPGGRLQAVVLARLSSLHGLPEAALAAALFARKPTADEVAAARDDR